MNAVQGNDTHVAQNRFSQSGRELLVGNERVSLLAEKLGQTPFYVYDRQIITEQIANFRQHMPPQIELHYAIKANPMQSLVNYLQSGVDGFDVASSGELNVALKAGMLPENISFAGPGKSDAELLQAVQAKVVINCESENELRRIAIIAEKMQLTAPVAIRVNPDFTLKTSGMKMGGGAQQFGIDAEKVPDILLNFPAENVQFAGFHIFSGSQNLHAEAIIDCQNKTLDLALELSRYAPTPPAFFNIGGGFGIPYFAKEKELELATIGASLQARLASLKHSLPACKIIIELGRFLVGPAGVYVCKILDIKESRGQKFLITNGGLHHHLAASGNFGQIIRKNYPLSIVTNMQTERYERVSVVGPLCTPLDLLGDKMLLETAQIGDLIGIFQSGAYGFSASPHGFLGHPVAAEILV